MRAIVTIEPPRGWRRLGFCLAGLLLSLACTAGAEINIDAPQIEPLWPAGSCGNSPGDAAPSLEIYHPFSGHPRAGVVVIIPGGGYGRLSPFDRQLAGYFRAQGRAAVVVDYRVLPHHYPAALDDVARAVRLVRVRRAAWKIPAGPVIVLGESAGGQLAALLATQPDLHHGTDDDLYSKVSARPDRLVLLCR